QAAADILHQSEIGNDIMRAGGEEHLGRPREILRMPAAPGAAMDEDKDGCGFATGAVDVEPFDLGRSVGDARGLAEAPARQFAVANTTLDQLLAVGRIGGLVIGCIQCRLVIIKEYRRYFFGYRTPVICAANQRVKCSVIPAARAQPASPEPMNTACDYCGRAGGHRFRA